MEAMLPAKRICGPKLVFVGRGQEAEIQAAVERSAGAECFLRKKAPPVSIEASAPMITGVLPQIDSGE
jgi:hypothetical protein